LALLTPGLTNSDGGTTRYAYFGSAEAQTNYEQNVLAKSDIRGKFTAATGQTIDDTVALGLVGDADDATRVFARYALLAHDYRPLVLDSDSMPLGADDSLHYHVKGWTLLGALQGKYKGSDSGASGGGAGFFGTIAGFLLDNIFPFKCCVRDNRLGHKRSEDNRSPSHIGESYPTW
jgi:hypothetical protein